MKRGTSEVNYSYLANGDKLSSLKEDGSGLVYRGPFVYRRSSEGALSFESAEYEGGRLEPNASYYYMTDHLGSTRAVARMDIYKVGDVVDYSSYGEKTQVSGTSLTRTYFTGKEDQSIDFALPYTDFGARHYSPSLHRWLTPDPRGLDNPTVSGYSYCNNDPINHIDPDGEFVIAPILPIIEPIIVAGIATIGVYIASKQESSKHSPGRDWQERKDREARDAQRERDLNMQNAIEENFPDPNKFDPNKDPEFRNGSDKSKVAVLVLSLIGNQPDYMHQAVYNFITNLISKDNDAQQKTPEGDGNDTGESTKENLENGCKPWEQLWKERKIIDFWQP